MILSHNSDLSNGRGNGSSVCVVLSSPDNAPLSFLTGGVDEVKMAEYIGNGEDTTFTPMVLYNNMGHIVIAFGEGEDGTVISFSLSETKKLIKDLQAALDEAIADLKV